MKIFICLATICLVSCNMITGIDDWVIDSKDRNDSDVIDGTDASSDNSSDSESPSDSDSDSDPTNNEPCAGVSCESNIANTCADESSLSITSSTGWCSDGECFWNEKSEPCVTGDCSNGYCEDTPCQGVVCDTPPQFTCEEDQLKIFASSGNCLSDGTCFYQSLLLDCEAGCDNSQCSDEPCANVTCATPPARYCDGDNLVIYDVRGHCDADGGCQYSNQTVKCGSGGCADGKCVDKHVCDKINCTRPPASFCKDTSTLNVFSNWGKCDEGMCYYEIEEFDCPNGCSDGKCEGTSSNLCIGVVCDFPPPSYCSNSTTLKRWSTWNGECEDGVCEYEMFESDCDDSCKNGTCTDDCNIVFCVTPPANYCEDENTLKSFDITDSQCEGKNVCVYNPSTTSCPNGCSRGACHN